MSDALVSVVTALGDDELVLGHRHSEWTGFAPHIEEDVAFSSIAQDEIGHAAAYYSMVASVTGDDPDRLALGRDKDEYRHAVICERPNGDWAYTLARHWLYDHADDIRLESLEDSSHEDLSRLVKKVRREERYHLLHAGTWLERVAQGPVEGRSKIVAAMGKAFPEAWTLFEPFEREDEAVKEGILPIPSPELGTRFLRRVTEVLDDLGIPTHEMRAMADESAEFIASSSGDLIAGEGKTGESSAAIPFGGRAGKHTDDFDRLWDDMTHTYRENPGATW